MSAPKRPAPPSTPNVDPPPPSLKKPRRNPALSCQLCRIKKIKCSRVFPCSNCVTRNVECIPQDASAISMSSPNNSSHSSTHNNQFYARWEGSAERSYGRSGPETSGMLSRPGSGTPNAEQKPLNPRRSFESSFRVNPDDDRAPSGICMLSMVASREAQIQDQDSIKTANFLEELAMGHQGGRPFNPEPPPLRPPVELAVNRGPDGPSKVRIAEWAQFLQGMLIPGKPNSPPDVRAVEHTPAALLPPTIQKPLHPYHENSLSRLSFFGSPKPQTLEHVLRQLPPEPRARQLLGNFFDLVHPFTQIVHSPTVLLYVDEVYRNGNALDTETLASVLSLLFTLMAVGAHHWPPAKAADLELTGAPPGQTALTAQHAALECLELANYMSCPTLETIQSCVLLPFVQRTAEDWAAARNIRGLTVKMCQTLGLHKLPDVSKLPESRVLYDVKRRLWWYIASSDWLHSSLGGAHQHTYLISASHLHTSFPSHCDDIDLSTYTTFPKPPSDPTDMSFFLARSHLADITRDIVDTFNTPTHTYDTLLTHDTRLQTWLKTLPPFFRAHKPTPATPIRPYIPWQRTLLTVMANDLLLRLHAPYMIRGSQEPRYAHSRMTILRAAHTLLRIYRNLYSDPSYPPLLRALAGIHTLFQAVLLLSIDLFCNEDEPHAEETRKQLVDACDLMERVRIQSSVADEGIGTLFAIVRRWREGCGIDDEEDDAGGEGGMSGWGEVLEWRGLEGEEFLDWSGLVREVGGCEGDAGWC